MLRHLRSLDAATLQRHQLLNLLLLFLIGKLLLNLPITWFETGVIVLFAVALDHLFIYLKHRRLDFFSYSAVNTALGVAFLLRVVEFEIYFVVIVLAIAQKHWLLVDRRHFLNPSNVAVVAGLILFPYDTYTTPEQWGGMWWLGVVMTILGLFITYRAGRALIPIAYSVAYVLLTYAFVTRNLTEIFYTLVSGSFLLFIYFMLTDPRTTPDRPGYQVVFAGVIAVLTTFLELKFGARDITMFLALFAVSLLIPVFRIAQERKARAWRYALGGLVAAVLAVGVSPLNGLNRLHTVATVPESTVPNPAPARTALEGPAHPIIWDSQPNWYQRSWQAPFVVAAPLEQRPREKGFSRVEKGLGVAAPEVARFHFGMDYNYHAPITAGDINHDGWLDLVLGRLDQSLVVLINRGDGTFFDATRQLFEQTPPGPVEQVALADFDSDSYLDLLVVLNPFVADAAASADLYRFDPDRKTFAREHSFRQSVRATSGGLALIDINQDRALDPYIVYAHDWYQDESPPAYFMMSDGVSNQFWVSREGDWAESKTAYFSTPEEQHAGMTAMFTDLNNDAKLDFILGNDMQPDLSYQMTNDGGFELIPKERIEYNVFNSMGYLGVDVDNDGVSEIWEHGISYDVLQRRTRYGQFIEDGLAAGHDGDIVNAIAQSFRLGQDEDCSRYAAGQHRNLCLELGAYQRAVRLGDRTLCDQVANRERRITCRFAVDKERFSLPLPHRMKRDVEKFPPKVKNNILLVRNESGRYENVLSGDMAALTGWSWAAYPFDLDSNGFQDLFVTTGMSIFRGSEPPALLMNYSRPGEPRLVNQTKSFGLDFKDEGRGVIAADFDGDGDGDVVVNNLYSAPVYLRNRAGGSAIQVELRSRRGNYFGIGSRIELRTNRGVQIREMAVGGIWDSAQPQVQHFGLAEGETIEALTIRWPYGETTVHEGITPNRRYAFYD